LPHIDLVYYLAAQTSIYEARKSPIQDINSNVIALLRLLDFLKKQNKPEYLCLAGLFHSIYETEYFKFNTPYTRNEVKDLIGEQAEILVYEFCNISPRTNKLIERSGNWSDQLYADLLDLEFVNAIEQGYYNDSVKTIEAIRKHLIIRD
jgi:hypothetical protein